MKEFLSRKNVPYVERDVSIDRDAAIDMVATSGQRGVPVIVIDGQVVVGFDRARLEQILGTKANSSKQPPTLGLAIADAQSRVGPGGPLAQEGAYVGRVSDGSIGARLGLQPGDVIVDINGRHIVKAKDVETALAALSSGQVIRVTFNRVDQWLTREVTI